MRTARALIATAIALIISVVAMGSGPVYAAGPFSCQPGFYQVISGQLKLLNPTTGVYTDIGSAGNTYNAIGYNPRDNYIYGWGTSGSIENKVIRIDSAGTVTDLGTAGLGALNMFSGDFDDNNNLYIRKNTSLIKVNVASNPPTSTELTLTGVNLGGADMIWINGFLYSIDGDNLYTVNLSTLVVTSTAIVDVNSPNGKEFPTTGSQTYGALFSNVEDELYASNNSLGRIYRVRDFNTPNPTATWVVDSIQTNNNDGAACKIAASPFNMPSATNDAFSVANDSTLSVNVSSGILSNDTANTPVVLSNTSPSSGTLSLNPDGSFTFIPASGFVGSTTFDYVLQDKWGRASGSATVTITVTAGTTSTTTTVAPTTTTATLAAPSTTAPPAKVDSASASPTPSLPAAGTSTQTELQLALLLAGLGGALLCIRKLRRVR